MNPHERARDLTLRERIEPLPDADAEWLERHVDACAACATERTAMDDAIGALRSVGVQVPAGLAGRAQMRVYLRANELSRHPRGTVMAWAACLCSWAIGAVSAPYVWHGFEWIGNRAGAPTVIWQIGFALWWALPALVATTVLLIEDRGGAAEFSDGRGEL